MSKKENLKPLSSLTPNELQLLLSSSSSKDLLPLMQQLNSKEHLEIVGKNLPVEQILECLSLSLDSPLLDKIPPIFVGMDQDKFEKLLVSSSDKQMKVIKTEGFTEAIAHHLTLLIHQLENERDQVVKNLQDLEKRIEAIDPRSSTPEYIAALHHSLASCEDRLSHALKLIQKTQEIAWSTSNSELIEKLNNIHISMQRIRATYPKDLKELVKKQLFSVYNTLKDEDPAIDGIANLAVWYPEDYVHVGLLSKVEDQEKAFQQVKESLSRLGLKTVHDLKDAWIYSKQSLKEFVKRSSSHPDTLDQENWLR